MGKHILLLVTILLGIQTSTFARYELVSYQLVGGPYEFSEPVWFADGTASDPSIGWLSDDDGTGTGWYRGAADEWWLSVNGEDSLSLSANTLKLIRSWTDASNYDQLKISATTGGYNFEADQAGTGIAARPFNFTNTLQQASGNEIACVIKGTTNKAAGDDTILKVVQVDTASPGTSYLQEWYAGASGTTRQAYISNIGSFSCLGSYVCGTGGGFVGSTNQLVYFATQGLSNASTFSAQFGGLNSYTQTSGANGCVKIIPTYNQTSGTAANTDLLINRTQTQVGSGAQLLQDWQVDNVSQASLDNTGSLCLGTGTISRKLSVVDNDAGTNTVMYVNRLTHTTSDTPAAGYGVGQEWALEDSTGGIDVAMTMLTEWTNATAGSEDADMVVKLMAGGVDATERLRVLSTGRMLGTFGTGVDYGFGRGVSDADITYMFLRNAGGTLCYIFPDAAGTGITVQTTEP